MLSFQYYPVSAECVALLVNTLLVSRLSLMDFCHLSHSQSWDPSAKVQKFAKNHVPKSEMPTGYLSCLSCTVVTLLYEVFLSFLVGKASVLSNCFCLITGYLLHTFTDIS